MQRACSRGHVFAIDGRQPHVEDMWQKCPLEWRGCRECMRSNQKWKQKWINNWFFYSKRACFMTVSGHFSFALADPRSAEARKRWCYLLRAISHATELIVALSGKKATPTKLKKSNQKKKKNWKKNHLCMSACLRVLQTFINSILPSAPIVPKH